jgi:hypothetical protein
MEKHQHIITKKFKLLLNNPKIDIFIKNNENQDIIL